MNYTLNQLRVFQKVVQTGSITKASQELHLTQPAVSIQLRNLQDQFAIPLTELIGRKLYITDFGKEVFEIAEDILSRVEAIEYKTMAYRGLLSGKLRFSAVSTGKYVLPHLLQGFMQQYPGIDLKLDVTNKTRTVEQLERNEVDFALITVLPAHMELQQEVLMPNRLFLVGPSDSPFARKRGKWPVSVFRDLPLIFREDGSGTRHTMQQYFRRHRLQPVIKMELATTEAVKQAVIAGLGYSVLSLHSLKNELNQGDVKLIPVEGLPLTAQWRMVWLRKRTLSPVARVFLDYLQKEKKSLVERTFGWVSEWPS